MIYVRVELWPQGDRSRPKNLGEAVIENVGGDETRGNYRFSVSKPAGFEDPTRPRTSECWLQSGIDGFPRKKNLGAWDLLCVLLVKVLHKRLEKWARA